jgi:hypothetical protein
MNIQQQSRWTTNNWLKKSRSDQSNGYKEAKRKDAAWQEIAQELDCDGINRHVCLFFVYGLAHTWHPSWLLEDARAVAARFSAYNARHDVCYRLPLGPERVRGAGAG